MTWPTPQALSEFHLNSTIFMENQVISGQTVWPAPRVHSIFIEIHVFHGKSGHFLARRRGRELTSTQFRPKSTFFSQNQVISGQTAWPAPRVHSISDEIHVFQGKSGHFLARWCGQHLVFTRFGPKSTFFSQNQVISWSDGDVTSRRRHVT